MKKIIIEIMKIIKKKVLFNLFLDDYYTLFI